MTGLITALAALNTALVAPTGPQMFRCGAQGATLRLTMRGISGGSYVNPSDARIMDNFHQGPLKCVGTLASESSVNCIGYDNGSSNSVFNVTIAANPAGNAYFAEYTFLRSPRGPAPQTPGPWPCILSPAAPPTPPSPPATGDQLSCRTASGVANMGFILDQSSWSGGYFTARDVVFNDNYHSSKPICIGHTLTNEISCLGFDNGSARSGIIEVTISPAGTSSGTDDLPVGNTASYSFIWTWPDGKPAPPQTPGKWPCTRTHSQQEGLGLHTPTFTQTVYHTTDACDKTGHKTVTKIALSTSTSRHCVDVDNWGKVIATCNSGVLTYTLFDNDNCTGHSKAGTRSWKLGDCVQGFGMSWMYTDCYRTLTLPEQS